MTDQAQLAGGALLLSFDDTSVGEWEAALPLFAATGAQATFFVSHADLVLADQREGLLALQAAGHAIGCHSLRHEKAVEAVARTGMVAYLDRDVLPALALLRAAGFPCTAFAYPNSQNDAATDAALLQHFRHLRTGRSPAPGSCVCECDALFVAATAVARQGCLVGTGIDGAGLPRRPDMIVQACAALDRARARREILVLYAHHINATGPGNHLPPEALRQILAHAHAIGLPALTFDDLP